MDLNKLKMVGSGLRVSKVYGSRVLVKTVKPYTAVDRAEKESGLYIPETVKDKYDNQPVAGIVVMCGDDVLSDIDHISEGDMVMFGRWSGNSYQIEQQDFRILDIKEVMCKVEAIDGSLPYEVTNA
jgi:co-chaperonin GroES (HSP10)